MELSENKKTNKKNVKRVQVRQGSYRIASLQYKPQEEGRWEFHYSKPQYQCRKSIQYQRSQDDIDTSLAMEMVSEEVS